MSSAPRIDAPPRGSLREVFSLAYPVVLSHSLHTTMGVVDSAFVGRLGATELAAVGFGTIWLWTVFSLFYGTASGVQVFVAQTHGAGEPQRCGAWPWQALYVIAPCSLLGIGVVALGLEPALALLGPSPELQAAVASYLYPRLPGEIALSAIMVFASFYRGVGDMRTPLYVALLANAVNAVLAYGLIFGRLGLPQLGVAGAGLATCIGLWVSALTYLALLRRRSLAERFHTRAPAWDPGQIRRFLRTGAPIGGQWFIGSTSFALFTSIVASLGDASMAASQAFGVLLNLSFMPAMGLSMAAATLVGRYVGAGDEGAAARSLRACLGLGVAFAACVTLLFVSVPEPLLRIFSADPEVIERGRPLLGLGAVFLLLDAAAVITQGALRGAGDTRFPFLLETLLGWGLFVPSAWLLGVVLGGGLLGAWTGGLVHVTLLSSLLLLRFRSGAWKKMRI
jgi:MATE family multidrug resistance protein